MSFHNISKGSWKTRDAIQNRVSAISSMTILTISISGDVYEKMGSPLFVRIALGSGDHAGMMLVRPTANPEGAYRINMMGGSRKTVDVRTKTGLRKFSMAVHKAGLPRNFETSTLPLRFSLTEEGLVITMPKVKDAVPPSRKVRAKAKEAA